MSIASFNYPQAIPPPLGNNEVHVWFVRLDEPLLRQTELLDCLNDDERHRAQTIRPPSAHERFCFGRAILRILLGHYLGTEAGTIPLQYSTLGKPALASKTSDLSLQFNVSHTNGLLGLAFCRSGAIGIDVENIRPFPGLVDIIDQEFNRQERALFFEQPPENQLDTFFRLWTRRESFRKALGSGLSGQAIEDHTHWTTTDWKIDPAYRVAVTSRIADRADRPAHH
jgi:4'-phosphopantetheinyl transferase